MDIKAMNSDLSLLDTATAANEGFDVHIINPKTGDETNIIIKVLGQDSDVYREIQRKQQARSLNVAFKTQAQREMKLVQINEENQFQLLAATTVSWTGISRDGEEFPFSKENADWVYRNYPIVRDQVAEAQRDRANFIKD
jgi:hypothetical protein